MSTEWMQYLLPAADAIWDREDGFPHTAYLRAQKDAQAMLTAVAPLIAEAAREQVAEEIAVRLDNAGYEDAARAIRNRNLA